MSRRRVAAIALGFAFGTIGLVALSQLVVGQQRHGHNLYAYRVLHEDVFVTLGKVSDEWASFAAQSGRDPRSVEEFLDARPSLKRAIRPRTWADWQPFEVFVPAIEVEGRRVIALSPTVQPRRDPLWPYVLRFAPNRLRDRRYVVTERGEIEPTSALPTGWRDAAPAKE